MEKIAFTFPGQGRIARNSGAPWAGDPAGWPFVRASEILRLERLPAPARRGERSRVGVAAVLAIDPEAGLAAHPGDATRRRVTGR